MDSLIVRTFGCCMSNFVFQPGLRFELMFVSGRSGKDCPVMKCFCYTQQTHNMLHVLGGGMILEHQQQKLHAYRLYKQNLRVGSSVCLFDSMCKCVCLRQVCGILSGCPDMLICMPSGYTREQRSRRHTGCCGRGGEDCLTSGSHDSSSER